ncbi:cadherin domain-containing protein, partial [Nostoc calcicola FACHB-3891]|nr:cadherin domain-containing protein [Nostoc calcicola FACHB-3891]
MANYTVTNTNDSGEGSLRQAILNTNANAGADTITFAGSTFTDSTPDSITLTSGQLSVTDSVTITGTGANLLTINGNNASRVFEFGGGGSKTYNLEGVTITGGNGVGNGTGFGGGINMNDGDDTLNIDRTVITGNTANSGGNTGGGLYVGFGTLNLTNSTVSNNTAGFAGGIRLQNLNASLSNVTVSGNSAVNTGGGIGHLATGTGRTSSLSLTNVTIANNSAAFGSALSNISQTGAVSAVTQYNNSIFANNTGSANIGNFGTGTVVQSLGYNISSDGSGNLTATGDLRNINPLLGSLQNNGGSTPTHALLPSSPAIGAGNTTLTTDQRGITRPQGAFDDIGAFELENAAPTNLVLNLSSIAENSPINTVVGSFVTTDPNRTDIYTYTFVGGASYPDNSLFTIDGSQLKANAVFDFESDNSYTIKVRTTDQNGLFDEKELTINITNVNETPTNLTLNNTSLAENSSVNSTIGTFSTTDPDTGDTFTYSLIPGNGDTDNNAFTIDGNQLKIKNSPNFETQSSYKIRVKSTDANGLSAEKEFTITVNNVNETPTDLTLSQLNVDENIATLSTIGSFSTTDPDAGDTFTYSLIPGNGDTDNNAFTIDGNQLKIKNSPNFETQSSYKIRVKSTDANGLSAEKEFTITVNNVNETPTDLTLSQLNVDENIATLSTIGSFSTTDPDAGDTFTYSLIPGNGDTDNNAFTIDGNQLKIKNSPNFETQSSYKIRVKSTDANGLSTEKEFTITVNNVNETPTDLTLSQLNVDENIAALSTIGSFSTTDPDAGDTFTYSLIPGNG